ncbi:MAG: hypothetical protein LBD54_02645 [Puniceicoccales bacterium]|jgi:hypothetical protein|nr:hypothetical protein [Puniceicoccales bacterium]
MTFRKQLIWVLLSLGALAGIRTYFRLTYQDTKPILPSLEGGDYHQYPTPKEEILNYRLPPYLKWKKPEALPLGPTWLFDLFTPPQITAIGKILSAELPEYVADPLEFELELVSFQRTPYRIQFEGYVLERPKAKASYKDYIIMLNDLRQNHTFRCTIGHAIPSSKISVSDFKLIAIETEEGVKLQEPIVTIYDQETEQYIDLGRERKFYDNVYTIVFRSLKSGDIHVLKNIGDSVSINNVLYILSDIDLPEARVTLRRVEEDGIETARVFGIGQSLSPQKDKKAKGEKEAPKAEDGKGKDAPEAPPPTR